MSTMLGATVLRDHYYRLGSEVPEERISAASGLISELTAVNDEKEWNYALERLLKGLSTTRQSARFGFSMALAELLRELITSDSGLVSVSSCYDRILDTTQVRASMKGKEERAILFGRLFGLQAMLNSGCITSKTSNGDAKKTFATILIELSTSKPWLRETSIFTLCTFIRKLQENNLLDDHLVRHILSQLSENGLTKTSEGIAVYLSIPTHQLPVAQDVVKASSAWKNGDPLSKGNLSLLSKALKEVNDIADPETENKAQQKSNWTKRLPFVWDLLLMNLVSLSLDEVALGDKKRSKNSSKASKKRKVEEQSGSSTRITLGEFWTVVVDESFFSEKSSPERKYWGFEIFCMFVNGVTAEDLPTLFSPNFTRCLINQSSHSNRLLHKMATRLLDCLTRVSADLFKAPYILASLLDESKGGCWNFDMVTKTKTVDSIIALTSAENLAGLSHFTNEVRKILAAQLDDAAQTDDEALLKRSESRQKWAMDKYLLLIRSSKLRISSDYEFAESILKHLIKMAFFVQSDKQAISANVRTTATERINSILAELMSVPRSKGSWPLVCVTYIRKLLMSSKYTLVTELEEELAAISEECYGRIQELNAAEDNPQNRCLELVFSMIFIQMYMGDAEAVTTYEDMKDYGSNGNSGSSAIVLTELVLSFVSRRSSLLRKVSMMIWETFLCGTDSDGRTLADSASMKLLYDILTAKENMEGQQKLFEGDDEYAQEGGSSDENSEADDEDEEDEQDDDDTDELGNEDDDNDQIAAVDKATNKKLAEALGIASEASGEVKFSDLSDDSDDGAESDSMDDEQMMEMDDQLSRIFKERKDALDNVATGNKRKAEVLEAKEQMTFFKNRVLDLLEVFVRKQPDSPLLLTMIEPLVVLIGLTLDKSLSVKAHKLMKTKLSRAKFTTFGAIDKSSKNVEKYLTSLLSRVQSVAAKSKVQAQGHACNQSCLIIAKALVSLDGDKLPDIIDIYSSFMKQWATLPKNKTQPAMFFDLINWINSIKK